MNDITAKYKVKTLINAIDLVLATEGRRLLNVNRVTRARINKMMDTGGILNAHKDKILEKAEELMQEEIKNEPERKRRMKELREQRKGNIHIVEKHVVYDD